MQNSVSLASGARMPSIGLGTYDPRGHLNVDMFKAALSLGYRHFDCAFLYQNEESIGEALSEAMHLLGVKREDLFITSKLPMNAMRPENVNIFITKSLHKLRLNYVDLYLIHAPFAVKFYSENDFYPVDPTTGRLAADTLLNLIDTWKAMEDVCREGLTRDIGVSNFNVTQLTALCQAASIRPSVIQVEMHPFLQQHLLRNYCEEEKIVVSAYGSLGSPLKAAKNGRPLVLENSVIKEIAAKYEKSAAQISLRYILQLGTTAVPNSLTSDQLKQNISLFDFKLSTEDMANIKKLDRGERIYYYDQTPGVTDHPEYPFEARTN